MCTGGPGVVYADSVLEHMKQFMVYQFCAWISWSVLLVSCSSWTILVAVHAVTLNFTFNIRLSMTSPVQLYQLSITSD